MIVSLCDIMQPQISPVSPVTGIVDDGDAEEVRPLCEDGLLPPGVALQAEVPVLLQVGKGVRQLLVRGEGAEEDLERQGLVSSNSWSMRA